MVIHGRDDFGGTSILGNLYLTVFLFGSNLALSRNRLILWLITILPFNLPLTSDIKTNPAGQHFGNQNVRGLVGGTSRISGTVAALDSRHLIAVLFLG
jgi:hypothetical protein